MSWYDNPSDYLDTKVGSDCEYASEVMSQTLMIARFSTCCGQCGATCEPHNSACVSCKTTFTYSAIEYPEGFIEADALAAKRVAPHLQFIGVATGFVNRQEGGKIWLSTESSRSN